jgi:sulfite exporter TauE/SafE
MLSLPDSVFLASATAMASFGFTGSLHCSAMCGPMAAASQATNNKKSALYYHGSRVASYAMLGGISGALGQWILRDYIGLYGSILTIVLGSTLLLFAVLQLADLAIERSSNKFVMPFANLFVRVKVYASLPLTKLNRWLGQSNLLGRLPKPVFYGLLTAFLPCGFLYAAVVQAVLVSDAMQSALMMIVFGMATAPALAAGSLGRSLLDNKFPRYARTITAGVLVVAALSLVYRGQVAYDQECGSHSSNEVNP